MYIYIYIDIDSLLQIPYFMMHVYCYNPLKSIVTLDRKSSKKVSYD